MKKASEVLNKQSSFSQWYSEASLEGGQIFKKEDEEKNERLDILHRLAGLPTNIGLDMPLTLFLNLSPDSEVTIAGRSVFEVPLGIRLIPQKDGDPLYRTRGKKYLEIIAWIRDLNIIPEDYAANILPHVESPDFSTIFVVAENGVRGEAVQGAPHLLTQGFYDDKKPITFSYDLNTIHLQPDNPDVSEDLLGIISHLQISDSVQGKLKSAMTDIQFVNGYLKGYFETVTSKEYGLWFIDYNRYLGNKLSDINAAAPSSEILSNSLTGLPVSKGSAQGTIKVIDESLINSSEFAPGDILVCKMTTPGYIPLMRIAAAIVTEQGGLLSHAAIISRELGIPCIAGVKGLLAGNLHNKEGLVNAEKGTLIIF